MSKRDILLIVEGERIDFRLMERLMSIYGIGKRHRIVPYGTHIFTLYNTMFRDADPSDLDILAHLREHEPNPEKKAIFDEHYSDILLVFDLDPHDSQFSADKIVQMAEYFSESTDMGKLYINYPMIEAFYHMKNIPDADYYVYTASIDELKSGRYKSRVNAENRNRDYTKFAVNKAECDMVIRQNIEKAWLVAEIPKQKNGLERLVPKSQEILTKQLEKLRVEKEVSILCTCVFYIVEYNSRLIEWNENNLTLS